MSGPGFASAGAAAGGVPWSIGILVAGHIIVLFQDNGKIHHEPLSLPFMGTYR